MQAQNREGESYGESDWISRAGRHRLVDLQVRERRRQPQGLWRPPLPLPSKSAALMQVTSPAHPAPAGRPTGRSAMPVFSYPLETRLALTHKTACVTSNSGYGSIARFPSRQLNRATERRTIQPVNLEDTMMQAEMNRTVALARLALAG